MSGEDWEKGRERERKIRKETGQSSPRKVRPTDEWSIH